MTSNNQFASELRKRVEAAVARGRVFDDAVESGLIDREGRLTRLFGGQAEPDPSARPRPELESGED